MQSTPNPYEPVEVDERPHLPAHRSYLMALIAGFLALAPSGFAMLILIETISVAQRQGFSQHVKTATIVLAAFVAFGLIWLLAAYFAWKGKKRRSIVITMVNLFAFATFLVFLAA